MDETLEEKMIRLRAGIAAAERAGDAGRRRGLLVELYLTGFAAEPEIEALRRMAATMPAVDPNADNYLAYMATQAGHWDLAAAVYETMERAEAVEGRELAIMLTNLASIYLEMQAYDRAADALRRATLADYTYVNAWGLRGMLLDAMGQPEDALAVLTEAYRLGARQPELVQRLRALERSVGR